MAWPPAWGEVAFARHPVEGPVSPEALPIEERAVLQGLESERRRHEWAAGRRAARAALGPLGGRGPVLPDAEGGPTLPNDPGLSVTLSHSRRQAVALAWRGDAWSLGIDLVEAPDGDRLRRVMRRWAKPREQGWLQTGPAWAPGLMWGAREAVAKATRTGMFAFALTEVWLTRLDQAGAELNWGGIELAWQHVEGELCVVARLPAPLAQTARAHAESARAVYESRSLR